MQDLHILLFTDGELDIDKVLCLYLLTAHKTETLGMPPKTPRQSFKARQLSPLERLIGRAKRRSCVRQKVFKNLPLFLLELPAMPNKPEPKRDPRLEDKVIVNTKIMRIINSVKIALEVSNPEMIRKFMYLAHDRTRIENAMMQPKMEAFYRSLHGQNIISCCESFELETIPKKGSISFRVDVEPLEELIRLVRSNVLLVPSARTWRATPALVAPVPAPAPAPAPIPTPPPCPKCDCKYSRDVSSAGPSNSAEHLSTILEPTEKSSFATTTLDTMKDIAPIENPSSVVCNLSKHDPEFFLNIDQCSDEDVVQRETMITLQPKIMKNLQLGFSNMQINEDDHRTTFDEDLPLEELAILLDQKVREEASMDLQNLMENLLPDSSQSKECVTEDTDRPTYGSYNVKQTTCIACLKRWSEPAPSPKISKIKRFRLPKSGEASYFSSRSAQRISDLIDRQVQKIREEERLARKAYRRTPPPPEPLPKEDQPIEIIDLNDMDLARIRQEIRVAETAKKLKKFFESA